MVGQALVVANDANLTPSWRDAHVVRTMLEMIAWLENATTTFVTVVLGGDYAGDREIIGFLRETYPAAHIVVAGGHEPSIATA